MDNFNRKIIYYANFNITFGDEQVPLLKQFDDILMPSLISGVAIGRENASTKFYFNDIQVKKVNEQNILCGNIIKSTTIRRYTTLSTNNELQDDPAALESAPYSRFIIFLRNHRMILVMNEAGSPDIRSFQKAIRELLFQYVREQNKIRIPQEKLPKPHVNIVDMPLTNDIEQVLSQTERIEEVNWRFYPLNADISFGDMYQAVNSKVEETQSTSALLQLRSPKSNKTIISDIKENLSKGLARVNLRVKNKDGTRVRIKENQFTSKSEIEVIGSITSHEDDKLIKHANEIPELQYLSDENAAIYQNTINNIEKWRNMLES